MTANHRLSVTHFTWAACLTLTAGVGADTLHVPAQYPTIQAAVNAAAPGDTVLVADGFYSETVDTLGKMLAIRSENGWESCAFENLLTHLGEGPGTRIEGFELTGTKPISISASAPTIVGCAAYNGDTIDLKQASPAFVDCLFTISLPGIIVVGGTPSFTGCTIRDGGLSFTSSEVTLEGCYIRDNFGPGVRLEECQSLLRDCTIEDNHNPGDGGGGNALGGGVAVIGGNAKLIDCHIARNIAGEGGYGCGGGGVYSNATAELTLDGCTLEDNRASDHFDQTRGGNAVLADGKATMTSCAFRGNFGSGGSAVQGDGVALIEDCTFEGNISYNANGPAIHADSGWVVRGCTFTGNQGPEDQSRGGAVMVDDGKVVVIDRCLFRQNTIDDAGGAVWLGDSATISNTIFVENAAGRGGAVATSGAARIINCTFVDNTADIGGAVYSTSGEAIIANSILWSSTPDPISGTVAARYSDIQGGYPGEGNIDADPLFLDPGAGDFRLSHSSPCIDAADNGAVPGGIVTDYAGLPRFMDDPATPDTGLGAPPIVDMGAREFPDAPCYADVNSDGRVDLFDFLAFFNAFNAGDAKADCTADGAFDLFDFLCFVNAFNAGC